MQADQPSRPKKSKCKAHTNGRRCTRVAKFGIYCIDHCNAPVPVAAPITPICEARTDLVGTPCQNSQEHDRYCYLHYVTHRDPPVGFYLNAIGVLHTVANGEVVEIPAALTMLNEIASRFSRYHAYVRSTDLYHAFFPDTDEMQDHLAFLLTALAETVSMIQITMYRNFDDRSHPNSVAACFSVLLDALRFQEDDERDLELPSTDEFTDAIRAYDHALLQSVKDGCVFPARVCVDLERMFSFTVEHDGPKTHLTLLDRVVQETTDEQIDRWLDALSACLPRYRQELQVILDEVLGFYGVLTYHYFQEVDGPKRVKIESTLNDRRHRDYVTQLALRGGVREKKPERLEYKDPAKELRDLDAAISRLRHIPERLVALALQTYPLPHTAAILALPSSDAAREAVERCKRRLIEMKATP